MRRFARLALALVLSLLAVPGVAHADLEHRELTFRASDGAQLHAFVEGEAPLAARPTVVDFSTYAPASARRRAGYNAVSVHARGTGRSGGQWDIVGPREQQDAREFLDWACRQPWSDGNLGLYGESSPAISSYAAMRSALPCVRAAALWSGASDLYRDIAYIGGIPNAVVSGGFMGQVAAPGVQTLQTRPQGSADHADFAAGYAGRAADYLSRPTQDAWWTSRAFMRRDRDAVGAVPILANTGWFDISVPSSFAAFRDTRAAGSRLRVLGAHDKGFPGASARWVAESNAWFDHHLRGIDNGIDRSPRVQVYVPDGGLERIHAGAVEDVSGSDWPLPGTRWRSLYLDPSSAGSADSLNDGSLSPAPPKDRSRVAYPFAPSNPLDTDPYNMAGLGISTSDAGLPGAERAGLTFTTPALKDDLLAVGPASVELRLASTAPETDIHLLLSDVRPEGDAAPIAVGRLRTSFPLVDARRSIRVPRIGIVEPYADFTEKRMATPGASRRYRVALWPVGNRFRTGHRIRLTIVGTPATSVPAPPGTNLVTLGGPRAARLLLPEIER